MPEPTEIDKFKSAVVTAAADAIAKEMTPERMRACATKVIDEALSTLNSSPYMTLGGMVKSAAEKIMQEKLASPEGQAMIKTAVEAGIADAMTKLPAEVRGRIIDLALRGIGKEIEKPERRW
jgi:hypothetical protein